MRKYQILKYDQSYAISDLGKKKIAFATTKDFSLPFEKLDIIETESATKPALIDYIKPIITSHGVHPIYNSNGTQCEQIVNVPNRIMSSEEILSYLNAFTILPQSTPPWDEIIYKLSCYCNILTNEYYDKEKKVPDISDLAAMFLNGEDVCDEHYFVTAPKDFEGKKGTIYYLHNKDKAHRRWIILDEYYDWKKNAWIKGDQITKRKDARVDLIDAKKKLSIGEIAKAKSDYFAAGGKITKLEVNSDDFDWKKLEIHALAYLMPYPSKEDRLALRESIKLNGVLEPIILYEGKILDGRTRQELCVELGIKPIYKQYDKKISARAYVVAMGFPRRHLTSSQKAAICVTEFLPEFEMEAKKRLILNGGDKTKKAGTQKIEEAVRGEACDLVAKAFQTNKAYVYDAKNIRENNPALFKKIIDGEISIARAKLKLVSSTAKKIKPRSKHRKFEKAYRESLKILYEYFSDNPFSFSSKEFYEAFEKLTGTYLSWNLRNDKTKIKQLESIREEYPSIFSNKDKSHLKLVIKEG